MASQIAAKKGVDLPAAARFILKTMENRKKQNKENKR